MARLCPAVSPVQGLEHLAAPSRAQPWLQPGKGFSCGSPSPAEPTAWGHIPQLQGLSVTNTQPPRATWPQRCSRGCLGIPMFRAAWGLRALQQTGIWGPGDPGVGLSSGPGLKVQAQSQEAAPAQPCSDCPPLTPRSSSLEPQHLENEVAPAAAGQTATLPVLGGSQPCPWGSARLLPPPCCAGIPVQTPWKGLPLPQELLAPSLQRCALALGRREQELLPQSHGAAGSQPPPGETLLGAHILRGAQANICSSWWHPSPALAPALPCFITPISAWGRAEPWG